MIEELKKEIVNATGYTALLELLIEKGIITEVEFIHKEQMIKRRINEQIQELTNHMPYEEIKIMLGIGEN